MKKRRASDSRLPVFMQDPKTNEILKEAAEAVPKGSKAYLVGGSGRNAVYYFLFRKKLPQRDYDVLFIGDRKQFVKNLRARGFIYGFIRRKHEVVLKKKIVEKPKHHYLDFVVLDIHFPKKEDEKKSVLQNLKENAGFTINGFVIPLKDVASKNWREKVIALPNALRDLKNKQLRVNVISHPANLYACLRFMSQGFLAPTEKEVMELLPALGRLPKYKFERNRKKIFDYVGGEEKARRLARKLGVKQDIFDFETIKKLKKSRRS